MKHIIILSGYSQRFLDQNYTIKPLININGKSVIEYVTQTLNLENFENVTFIIKNEDVINYKLDDFLFNKFKKCNIKIIDAHRNGPVYSVLQIQNYIEDDTEVLVTYCDLYIKWDIQNLYSFIKKTNSDGVIVTHTGWHPHRIYNNSFAYLRVDGDKVLEIKEKAYFTDNPITEYASGGIYYFKTGNLLKYYFNKLISENIRVNNEFYVTMPYNLMISDGLKVTHFDSKNYVCLGTPKDLEIFNSYLCLQKHITDHKNLCDVIDYFKQYNN